MKLPTEFLGFKIATYWHPEMFFIVPFAVWFVWRVETIVHLLHIISLK